MDPRRSFEQFDGVWVWVYGECDTSFGYIGHESARSQDEWPYFGMGLIGVCVSWFRFKLIVAFLMVGLGGGRVEGVCLHLSYSLHFEIRDLCFAINCLNLPDVAETNVITKTSNFSRTGNYWTEKSFVCFASNLPFIVYDFCWVYICSLKHLSEKNYWSTVVVIAFVVDWGSMQRNCSLLSLLDLGVVELPVKCRHRFVS